MTDNATVLEAIAFKPMTGAEIGRGFAPDHIKDREGWGRKWLKAAIASGIVHAFGKFWTKTSKTSQPRTAGLNLAQEFYQQIGFGTREYKAAHANRPTPPRPRYSRYSRTPRFCNH